jgi:hypothetical protein
LDDKRSVAPGLVTAAEAVAALKTAPDAVAASAATILMERRVARRGSDGMLRILINAIPLRVNER